MRHCISNAETCPPKGVLAVMWGWELNGRVRARAEIYNEEIRDLLARNPKNKLELKENADGVVYVKDLSDFTVKSGAFPCPRLSTHARAASTLPCHLCITGTHLRPAPLETHGDVSDGKPAERAT